MGNKDSKNYKEAKYYQVINGKSRELEFKYNGKNTKLKQDQFFKKQYLNIISGPKQLSFSILNANFKNFEQDKLLKKQEKPINSNYIKHVELPIKIMDKNNKLIGNFSTVKSYIEAVKAYIIENTKKQTLITIRKINLDHHISHEYIKPYQNEESKIIIITITPWNSKLIALTIPGEQVGKIYGRIQNTGQPDYCSDILSPENQQKIEKERLRRRTSKYSNKPGGSSIDFMDLVDYMGEEDIAIETFENILDKMTDELIKMTDSSSHSLLMFAIYYERKKLVEPLLKRMNVTEAIYNVNDKEETAFLIACKQKD